MHRDGDEEVEVCVPVFRLAGFQTHPFSDSKNCSRPRDTGVAENSRVKLLVVFPSRGRASRAGNMIIFCVTLKNAAQIA